MGDLSVVTSTLLGFPGGSAKNPSANARDVSSIPRLGRSPGEGKGNPLSILPWEIPRTKEPGGLQSMGSQNVTHDFTTTTKQQQ